ncbi:MAG: HAD family hydrolase [Erysipelotrichaceae bacterium]|nr:HAD family hydrolase [Erysipelotrichaceae bacterium]
MIKLIVSDLDGTLFKNKEGIPRTISPENLQAIRYWRSKGIVFMCASGRPISQRKVMEEEYGFPFDFIGNNGGNMALGDEIVYENLIPQELFEEFIDFMKVYQSDCVYSFIFDDYSVMSEYNGLYEKRIGGGPMVKDSTHMSITDYFEQGKTDLPVRFFIVVDDKHNVIPMMNHLKEHFGDRISVLRSGSNFIEVMNSGVNKGVGVMVAAQILDFTLDEVVTIGDEENDISMLQLVPHSFAMSQGPDIVKQAAHDEVDYVWQITEKLGL